MTTNRELIDRLNATIDDDDDRAFDARSLLIDPDDPALESDAADALRAIIRELNDNAATEYHDDDRAALSMLLLEFSLCPMHRIDYAICFDDLDPDCAAIRTCFPSHDT